MYCTSGNIVLCCGNKQKRRLFTFGEMGKGLKQEEKAYIMDLTFTNRIWPCRAELASGCKAERKLHGGETGS